MDAAPAPTASAPSVRSEFGPLLRAVAKRYFPPVRVSAEAETRLRALNEQGFVIHVMRSTAWVNYLYLAWTLVSRGLPPLRAVVNLRPWLGKPWRKAARRGDHGVRFTYARRVHGSGLIFLRRSLFGSARGRDLEENPFPSLVAMARRADRPVFLVPELFAWSKWSDALKPGLNDYLFGSPEAPGFLHTVLAFWRNHHRAQFRVGEPIDLRRMVSENPGLSDEQLGSRVRSMLYRHLARETRAVFGPPFKHPDRLLEETLRDPSLR
ncbi:MAG TPA: glycerol-3-phosphate acyltransferase, partial [Myxococcaceae bacterium]|nr:glycerol-3-phosphate acyltransferase [Myxococcaceae bacterium]